MKKYLIYILTSFCLTNYVYANSIDDEMINRELSGLEKPYDENTIKEYIKIFNSISKEREVVQEEDIDSISNPFYNQVQKSISPVGKEGEVKQIEPTKYELFAILENRANINHKWYRVNSKISGVPSAKLLKINKNSVVLKIANKIKEIKINKGSENVEISFQ